MKTIIISYNPYRLETEILVDGAVPERDNRLQSATAKGKRLQEWVPYIPDILDQMYNGEPMKITFRGMALDWDDLCEAFEQAKRKGISEYTELVFEEAPSNEEVKKRIIEIYEELQNGPIEELRDSALKRAFDRLTKADFPINVIATMSSGKSTLINSLLRKELMPARNKATTATITEILDTDVDVFTARAVDSDGNTIETVDNLTYSDMDRMNDNQNVSKILAEGNIPFIDSDGMALNLIDTPGPNNSRDDSHRQKTYDAISGGANNLILYVLNGTQLETNDDHNLLEYVSKQIKEGGKQARDRFLFVINKMDQYDPEKESIPDAIEKTREYLNGFGITDPQIYPCSAFASLNINTKLDGINLNNPTEIFASQSALQVYPIILKLNQYEDMHLEKYTTLSPSAKKALDERLVNAIRNNDVKEQALIHSGICSIEAAITAYVKKYAITKTVKDLVETLEATIEKQQIVANAKKQISENEAYANECKARAESVTKQIQNGENAKEFKKKVDNLNPIPEIESIANDSQIEAVSEARTEFSKRVGGVQEITTRTETRELIAAFSNVAKNIAAKLQSDLSNIVEEKLNSESRKLIEQYAERLAGFDENTANNGVGFSTSDLIKDKMVLMQENVERISSRNYMAEIVEDIGETTIIEEQYVEVVGQETVKVFDHKEKVGSHEEYRGTRKKANPKKKGIFGKLKFWQPDEIEEDVYETVIDYKDVYRNEKRDIVEKKTRKVEKYSITVTELSSRLVSDFEEAINSGIDEIRDNTKTQVETIKKYFKSQFDVLDKLITEKYDELNKCSSDAAEREKTIEAQKKVLTWLEEKMQDIRTTIDLKVKEC